MNDYEFVLAFIGAFSATMKIQIAVLYKPATNEILGMGTHTAGNPSQTPDTAIVNALQLLNDADLRQCWCISTYAPTLMCSGMASVRNVGAMIWRDNLGRTQGNGGLPANRIALTAKPPALQNPNTKPNDFLNTIEAHHKAKTLGPEAAKIVATLDKVRVATERAMPDEVFRIFSRLPRTAAPLANTLNVEIADEIFMDLALALVGMTWNPAGVRWESDATVGERFGGNNVGAVIVHQDAIIGWGINVAAKNRTYHAETLAIQTYLRRTKQTKLPTGCKIYSSLQPCHMCAGFITQVGTNVRVLIGGWDHRLSTVLDNGSSKRVNGCYEVDAKNHFASMDKKNKYKKIDEAIAEIRRQEDGPTTKLLYDPADFRYRNARLTVLPKKLTPDDRDWLAGAEEHKRRGGYLSNQDFNDMRNLRRVVDNRANILAARDLSGIGPLGKVFQSYLATFLPRRKTLNTGNTPNTNRANEQCIDLLKIVAIEGMATAYGMTFVEAIFDEMFADAGRL